MRVAASVGEDDQAAGDSGADELLARNFEFAFRLFSQDEGVHRRYRKSSDRILTNRTQPADLADGALDDGLPDADLPVARDDDLSDLKQCDDRCAVPKMGRASSVIYRFF